MLNRAGLFKKGFLEIVGRSDSDWAGDSATRQCVTGYHCDVQNVTMRNRSLRQTAISLSSREAEFYAASACVGELLGLAQIFKELHYNVSVRLDTQTRQDTFCIEGNRWSQTYRHTMLGNTTVGTRETSICKSSGHEEQHCRSLHETSGWIANAVARKESWTSTPGWYELYTWGRPRNGDD